MNQTLLFIWVLQIILESLPISSSSHIYLLSKLLGKYRKITAPEIPEYLEHLMHAPTAVVLSVFLLMLYVKYGIFSGILGTVFLYVILADAITTVFYVFFHYFPAPRRFMPIGFMLTGLSFLSLYFLSVDHQGLHVIAACIIGVVQGLAFLPGISRLGVTFIVGCWLGLPPIESIAFSCAIQLPLIWGALCKSILLIVVRKAPRIMLSLSDVFLLIIASIISFFCLVLVLEESISLAVAHLGWYLLFAALLTACSVRLAVQKQVN